jgi:hypothetical protein
LKENQIEAIKARCLQDKDERAEESLQTFLAEEQENGEEPDILDNIVAMFDNVVRNQPIVLDENFLLRTLIAQGAVGRGQVVAPVEVNQNRPVVTAPFNADFDGDVDPVDLVGMMQRAPQRVFHDPAAGSAEELAILSWILDRKMEGIEISHEGLHLRYTNYSCAFLTSAEERADTFLAE